MTELETRMHAMLEKTGLYFGEVAFGRACGVYKGA